MEIQDNHQFNSDQFKQVMGAILKSMGESMRNAFNSPTGGGVRPLVIYPESFLDENIPSVVQAIASVSQMGYTEAEKIARAITSCSNFLSGSGRVFDETTSELFINCLGCVLENGLLISSGFELTQEDGSVELYYGTSHWSYPGKDKNECDMRSNPMYREVILLNHDVGSANGFHAVIQNILPSGD